MKKLLLLLPALILVGMFFYGCQEELNIVEPTSIKKVTINETGTSCTPIYAGQNMLAGSVCLEDVDTNNDGIKDALKVTYSTDDPWVLLEIHFAISKTLKGIPQTRNGNLIPGQFPFKYPNLGGVSEYTFYVPFSFFGFNCDPNEVLYAAAHCVVAKPDGNGGYYDQETGWGYGNNKPGNNWATIFSLKIDCEDNGGGDEKCETAFAFGGEYYATCFTDLTEISATRWGWTNGSLEEGSYTFNIYAGAGQCDLTKGTLVGTLSVVYSSGAATVTYNIISGFTMDEIHLYVGSEILPWTEEGQGGFTVAPGQYPIVDDDLGGVTTKTYTVSGLTGDIYVVAHAVVCWEE